MAFPAAVPIQSQFNRYQSPGIVGQLAQLDNSVWFRDTATIAVDAVPGDGAYLDTSGGATTGQWLLPTTGNEDLVTHILAYNATALNVDITLSGNQTSAIEYLEGDTMIPAFAMGSLFVLAGATILRGQLLQYEAVNANYIINTLATPKLLIVALEDADSGAIVPVRINRLA